MKKWLRIFLFTSILLAMQSPAFAALPNTDPLRVVEAERAAAKARQMLFLMAYAAQPVCNRDRRDWNWALGPLPKTVPAQRLENLRSLQAQSDAIAKQFSMKPGDSIFLSEIEKTPWGYAGLKTEEPFEFELKGEQRIQMLNMRREAASNEASGRDGEIRANPFTEILIAQKGESIKLLVKRVPVCVSGMNVIDSKFSYADSSGPEVIVTVPLLTGLTQNALVVIVAHEVAHIALKLNSLVPPKYIKPMFGLFGKLQAIDKLLEAGQNHETGFHEPRDTDLIQADRLAMRLASGFGVDVPTYADTLRKLVAQTDSFGAPTYRRTRGISTLREEQLQRSVNLWKAEKEFDSVSGFEESVLSDVLRRARQAHSNPEVAFGAVKQSQPNLVNESTAILTSADATKPLAITGGASRVDPLQFSSFADVQDSDAIPFISEKGRENYRKWLFKAAPRAFAISSAGASSSTSGTNPKDRALPGNPSERAVVLCNRLSRVPCQLYAVDSAVVWTRSQAASVTAEVVTDKKHITAAPAPTNFSELAAVDAVPNLGDTGRRLYREWLTKPFPRAVAISDKGAIARGYGINAMETAIKNCEKFNSPCRLFAVDDQVVWTRP